MPNDFLVQNQVMHISSHDDIHKTLQIQDIGTLFGQQVSVIASPVSLLADAAEELTFAVDTTDEFELSERKEKESLESHIQKRVELYKELMHQLGHSSKIDMLKENIQSLSQKEDILKEVFLFFPDYTDSYTALQSVFDILNSQDNISEDLKKNVKGALQELLEQHEEEIHTGLHGALSAVGFEDIGSSYELRDLYRQSVLDFKTVQNVFFYVQEHYGYAHFDRAIAYLFSALSMDINSSCPSFEKTQLEYIYGNLGKIRLLQSAYILCEEMFNEWNKIQLIQDNSFSAMDLLSSLLSFEKIPYLGFMHIEDIVKHYVVENIEKKVLFLQMFMSLLRQLPETIYENSNTYQRIISVSQETLDKAIQKEDEYLANME